MVGIEKRRARTCNLRALRTWLCIIFGQNGTTMTLETKIRKESISCLCRLLIDRWYNQTRLDRLETASFAWLVIVHRVLLELCLSASPHALACFSLRRFVRPFLHVTPTSIWKESVLRKELTSLISSETRNRHNTKVHIWKSRVQSSFSWVFQDSVFSLLYEHRIVNGRPIFMASSRPICPYL